MDALPETPCYSCGVRAGGRLKMHGAGCAHIQNLSTNFPVIKNFLEGVEQQFHKEPRKNAKH